MARKKKEAIVVEPEVVEEVNTVEEINIVEPEIIEEVNNTEPEVVEEVQPVTYIAVVTGCAKLYVRKESNKDSEPLCTIDESTEVEVDETNSTDEFFKVCTSSGIEGYCMKKYISAK